MTRDRSTTDEVAQALRRCFDQCAHITAVGRAAFLADDLDAQMRRLAGERLVITVSAALDDLPEAFARTHDDLPFTLVQGMRNRLAHGYDDIDATILWTTLDSSLPRFIEDVLTRLDERKGPGAVHSR